MRVGEIFAGIDGYQHAFVLAKDESDEYKMRCTVAMAHLEDVDVEKLVELGVCQRKCFKIC